MEAIILCAGEGTRLRPLTHAMAKHLLPIANRPVIDLILEGTRIEGVKGIEHSLIGRNTEMRQDEGKRSSSADYNFILGDDSRISI